MAGAATIEHRATPAAAFGRAREIFRSGKRLDMAQLAADLGVARATLYRWTGDRNRLLGDIAWSEVESLIGHFDRSASGSGAERLQHIADGFLDALANNRPLSAFLALEGDAGLRLLTLPTGDVRPRIIAAVAGIIERESAAGHYRPPDDPQLLADGIVSLGERFLYHAGDPTMNPDPQNAKRIIQLLLREPV
jgi:AcrR family transcriptional regulator